MTYYTGISPTPRGWQSQAERDIENRRLAEEEEKARLAARQAAAREPEAPPDQILPELASGRGTAPSAVEGRGPVAEASEDGTTGAGPSTPTPAAEPVPSDAAGGVEGRSPSPSELEEDLNQPDGPSPSDGEEQNDPVPRQVADWVNRHWDLVKTMACAGEAPQRPAPPPRPENETRAEPPAEPPPRVHVPRGDRWNKKKMADFLRQLAATHSVTAAARSVGMSRESAHRLRNRLKGQPFDIAWEAAFRHGYDNLAHAALELALEGEEVPHYHQGELKGTHRKRHPQLMVQLLKLRNHVGVPMLGRYGAAAEYWGENWDMLLQRVETGAVDWSDEKKALGEDELKRLELPDEERKLKLIEARNQPDDPPGKRGG